MPHPNGYQQLSIIKSAIFIKMNHGCRAGVDWCHSGVVAKALVGLWVWAQWWQVRECPSAGWGRHAGPSGVKVMRLPAPMW